MVSLACHRGVRLWPVSLVRGLSGQRQDPRQLALGKTVTQGELPVHLTRGTCFPCGLVPTSVQGLVSFFPCSHSMILRKCPKLMNTKVYMTNRKCPLPDNFYFDRKQGPAECLASSAKALSMQLYVAGSRGSGGHV